MKHSNTTSVVCNGNAFPKSPPSPIRLLLLCSEYSHNIIRDLGLPRPLEIRPRCGDLPSRPPTHCDVVYLNSVYEMRPTIDILESNTNVYSTIVVEPMPILSLTYRNRWNKVCILRVANGVGVELEGRGLFPLSWGTAIREHDAQVQRLIHTGYNVVILADDLPQLLYLSASHKLETHEAQLAGLVGLLVSNDEVNCNVPENKKDTKYYAYSVDDILCENSMKELILDGRYRCVLHDVSLGEARDGIYSCRLKYIIVDGQHFGRLVQYDMDLTRDNISQIACLFDEMGIYSNNVYNMSLQEIYDQIADVVRRMDRIIECYLPCDGDIKRPFNMSCAVKL